MVDRRRAGGQRAGGIEGGRNGTVEIPEGAGASPPIGNKGLRARERATERGDQRIGARYATPLHRFALPVISLHNVLDVKAVFGRSTLRFQW